ncbi:hypothetical protein JYT87_02820 [Nitrospira defluvii]|nr:hypothetical protein [Nitrospira defluvii]
MAVNGQPPVNYQYDGNSRLTQVAQGPEIVGLGYDIAGRRTTLSYPNGTSTSYTYDAASQLTGIVHKAGVIPFESLTYTYDAAGNRISLDRTNGVSILLPDAVQAAYDAANEQIQFNSPTPNLSYDANDIMSEIGGEAVGVSYLRSLNIDEPLVRQSTTNEYYHVDALGSTLELSDEAGAVVTTYEYEAFGKTTINGTPPNPFQYTGRKNDGTGLYYYRARYYSSGLQRFVSKDPLPCERRKGNNLYSYVDNNPTNFIDPLGLEKEPPCPPGGCSAQSFKCYTNVTSFASSLGCLSVCARICIVGVGSIPPAGSAVCAACYTACAGNLAFNVIICRLEEQDCQRQCSSNQ